MKGAAILLLFISGSLTCSARKTGDDQNSILSPPSNVKFLQQDPNPVPVASIVSQPYVAHPVPSNNENAQSILASQTEKIQEYFSDVAEKIRKFFTWGAEEGAAGHVVAAPLPHPAAVPAPVQKITAGTCFFYNPGYVNINDWENAAYLGWATSYELGASRISFPSPVIPPNVVQTVLKSLRCNAAEYSARIRLDDSSSAGIVFRTQSSSDRNSMVVELNTLTKSIALKQVINGVPTILDEHTDEMIQPQILQKVDIIDHGRDGLIEIELNDKPKMKVSATSYNGAGSFGPWISQGNAVFSDFSSKEL